MLLGPIAALRGAATHRRAGTEGLSLLLATAPLIWVNASWCTESSNLALRCWFQWHSSHVPSHHGVTAWHGKATHLGRLRGLGQPPGEGLSEDERCQCQAGCPGSPLAKVSGGSWERKNWQLGRMSLHFPSSCSRLNDVPYLAFLTDRRNLMAETVTA